MFQPPKMLPRGHAYLITQDVEGLKSRILVILFMGVLLATYALGPICMIAFARHQLWKVAGMVLTGLAGIVWLWFWIYNKKVILNIAENSLDEVFFVFYHPVRTIRHPLGSFQSLIIEDLRARSFHPHRYTVILTPKYFQLEEYEQEEDAVAFRDWLKEVTRCKWAEEERSPDV